MKPVTILLVLLALTACGAKKTASAPDVVRAWSAALDRGDNEQAARYFADGAHVIQNVTVTLANHGDALRWNASLPCGGRISHLEVHGKTEVLAVFELGDRPRHHCDTSAGTQAAALFRVENGRIVLWHQTPVPDRYAPNGTVI